jgi:hypothetical protein
MKRARLGEDVMLHLLDVLGYNGQAALPVHLALDLSVASGLTDGRTSPAEEDTSHGEGGHGSGQLLGCDSTPHRCEDLSRSEELGGESLRGEDLGGRRRESVQQSIIDGSWADKRVRLCVMVRFVDCRDQSEAYAVECLSRK